MKHNALLVVFLALGLFGTSTVSSPHRTDSNPGLCMAAPILGRGEETRARSGVRELLADADASIEKLRKADATLLVVDQKGKPIPNCQVSVEQIQHDFLFGCAALSLLKHSDSKQEERYQERFAALFNFATVLTYWQDTDPERDRRDLEKLSAQVERLNALQIRVKGHPLILAGACPAWAPADPDQVRELTRQRIQYLVSHFKGQITVWDVVGDVTTASGAQNGLGAWARKAGPTQLTSEALRWAHGANPDALVMYNDYKLDSDYSNLILGLSKSRAPLGALGLEAHMIGAEWPLEKIWQTVEDFGSLKVPLHLSEITVLSDDPKADHSKGWPSTAAGEQRQAEYVEQLYTLLFSHPSVQAIAWWNFVDGDWDRYPGGLLRADLTPKPAYERLHRLIHEKWWTRTALQTDANGRIQFRGFTGRYKFLVQTAAGNATLEGEIKQGKRNVFRVRLK